MPCTSGGCECLAGQAIVLHEPPEGQRHPSALYRLLEKGFYEAAARLESRDMMKESEAHDKVAGRGTKGLRDIAPINAELHYVQFLEMDAWKVWRKLST